LAFATYRSAKQRKRARAAYFSQVEGLFDRVATRIEPTGFPRLTAHLGDLAFDLQALPDSLTFRKLPALWVMVSLPEPMPVKATLDIMTRPTGQEPFTGFNSLRHNLPGAAFLPEGCGVRSDDADLAPDAQLIARHAGVFADPLVKELLISPKGVRLVILGDEADRGRFLIFRDAEVGRTPLSPERLTPLLHSLTALRADLKSLAKDPS
jgi:hypothetical protein